jgi:hypothetical protein
VKVDTNVLLASQINLEGSIGLTQEQISAAREREQSMKV